MRKLLDFPVADTTMSEFGEELMNTIARCRQRERDRDVQYYDSWIASMEQDTIVDELT